MELVHTSQVNAAYRRFFLRLFDTSEIREWAVCGRRFSGEFTLVHGARRPIARIAASCIRD